MSPIPNVYKNILHHITITNKGIIVTTNNTLFTLVVGENIKDFHPIFITSIPYILREKAKYLALPGVSVTSNKTHFYCDVQIKKELGFLSILFFNYTKSYKIKHKIAQITNETLLSHANQIKLI